MTGRGELASTVVALAERIAVRVVPLGPYIGANFSPPFSRAVREAAASAHVVHSHGLWLHPNWAAAAAARRVGVPLVISPRGMLQPVALARKGWLKKILLRFFDGRHLRQARLIHVTSDAEATAVRRLGMVAAVATIPNGVDLDAFPLQQVDEGNARRQPGRVVYLGRIHPTKGLDVLLAAWPMVRDAFPHSVLVVAGPGEPWHLAAFRRQAGGVAGVVSECGREVGPRERLELLATADVVVLPSRTENYGMVVPEALACRTPVVTTTGTPWCALETERCGWWVEAGPAALARALVEALSLDNDTRQAAGERGRAFVEREHSVTAAAGRMVAAYQWACGLGPPPPFLWRREGLH